MDCNCFDYILMNRSSEVITPNSDVKVMIFVRKFIALFFRVFRDFRG